MIANERGSGSLLAVAVIAVALALATLVIPLYGIAAVRQSAATAADAAALAAADALTGVITGYPCERADQAARVNLAELVSCEVEGITVSVVVGRPYLGGQVRVASRAGPPQFHPQQ